MSRETNEEKDFSEDIDRVLAGQEVKAGEDVSDDYSTALQFAQKLKGLGDAPSPVFKNQLRRRLLLKLAGHEAERRKEERASFWEALRKLVPRSPVWRTATVTVVVAVLAVIVVWGTGIFTQAPGQWAEKGTAPAMVPTPVPAPLPTAPEGPPVAMLDSGGVLKLEPVPAETKAYLLGEEVKIELVFRNAGSESIEVAPFPPAIQISQADTGEVVRSFAPGVESVGISASGTLTYTLVWNQLDDSDQPVEPGRYSVIVGNVTTREANEPEEAQLDFGTVTELIIQSP